tara:strand:+ start:432 stop:692 length:261 start_codon:yes stop_codon:yes gene_type:complete
VNLNPLIERKQMMLAEKKKNRGRPFSPFKHERRGRPKESILRAFLFYLKYSKASHVLKVCKERGITITQYFDVLVSKDIESHRKEK